MHWFKRMGKQWFAKTKPLPKVIIVGIDTHCYQLAQTLIEHKDAEIVAFIDNEPWTNRTELLGAKVHYPSDMAALVLRKEVQLIIDFEQANMVPELIKTELDGTSVKQVCLSFGEKSTAALSEWRFQVLQAVAAD